MNELRLGIIGMGGMGTSHLQALAGKPIPRLRVTAVCDVDPVRVEKAVGSADGVKGFADADALMASGEVDAVLIATPHYFHPPLAIQAFEHGLHVLSEKPAGVYTQQVKEMNAAAVKAKEEKNLVFGIMFNQRTRKSHQAMRKLIQSGELGTIRRTMYCLTSWFRTQYYYDTASWKGTWEGEGGAVLLNQAPHNLDLFQWICGMPRTVRAFAKMGHHHAIETEDEVTAYVEYDGSDELGGVDNAGATGVFVTSTGEAPGTDFMDVAGDRGSVRMDGSGITFRRLTTGAKKFLDEHPGGFDKPDHWTCTIPGGGGSEHRGILENFTDAVLDHAPLLAPGTDGLAGVTLANAMLLSAWTDQTVTIPFDDGRYAAMLKEKADSSTFVKREVKADVRAVASF